MCHAGWEKSCLGLKLAASIRDLTFREQNLPWAHFSMILEGREYKLPSVIRAGASACWKVAGAISFPTVRAVAIAASRVGRRRGSGLAERHKIDIGVAKRDAWLGESNVVAGENVAERSHRRFAILTNRSAARVISKSAPSPPAKKFCVIVRDAT